MRRRGSKGKAALLSPKIYLILQILEDEQQMSVLPDMIIMKELSHPATPEWGCHDIFILSANSQ